MHIPFICPIFHGSLFFMFFPRFVKVDSLFKIEMGCSKFWQTNIMENISCEWGVYILVSVQVAGGGGFHHAVESLSHYHDYDRNMQRPWQYMHINFWPLIHDVWIFTTPWRTMRLKPVTPKGADREICQRVEVNMLQKLHVYYFQNYVYT